MKYIDTVPTTADYEYALATEPTYPHAVLTKDSHKVHMMEFPADEAHFDESALDVCDIVVEDPTLYNLPYVMLYKHPENHDIFNYIKVTYCVGSLEYSFDNEKWSPLKNNSKFYFTNWSDHIYIKGNVEELNIDYVNPNDPEDTYTLFGDLKSILSKNN